MLNREHVPDDTGTATRMVYTVKLLNRNTSMLFPQENIPAGERHFVSGVPRHAIYFTDLPYSTDQHLTYAFRHWIGGMDDLYPQAWMDCIRQVRALDDSLRSTFFVASESILCVRSVPCSMQRKASPAFFGLQ